MLLPVGGGRRGDTFPPPLLCNCRASRAPSWHPEKFGKFKNVWRVYLLLSSLPGSQSQEEGRGKWGGVEAGGGDRKQDEKRDRPGKGVGTPHGAPQLAWLSSECLGRTRKTPTQAHPVYWATQLPRHPAPYLPRHTTAPVLFALEGKAILRIRG